jgi:hypothetical protein
MSTAVCCRCVAVVRVSEGVGTEGTAYMLAKNLTELIIRIRFRVEIDAFNSTLPFSHCEPPFTSKNQVPRAKHCAAF